MLPESMFLTAFKLIRAYVFMLAASVLVFGCAEARRERCELFRDGIAARAVECAVDISGVELSCGTTSRTGPDPTCLTAVHEATCFQLFGDDAEWRGNQRKVVSEVFMPESCAKR